MSTNKYPIDVNFTEDRRLTVREAADALGLTENCLRAWVLRRKVASYRIGRLVRIPRSEIQRVLESGYVPAKEAGQ